MDVPCLKKRRTFVNNSLQVATDNFVGNTSTPKQFYRRVLPDICIDFSSDKGKQVFKEALLTGYMECYFNLAAQFRTQDEPAFCGLSTLVMALNALEVDPKRLWKGVWRWYHEYMLDCCIPIKVVESQGITLDQMACLAACNTLTVKLVRASDSCTEDDFRNTVKTVAKITDQVLIVSYDRGTLQQTGTGHFSPIAGYHPDSDLVLILDVARFKYPPYWVPVPLLWKALQVLDVDTGLPRGYMIVQKSQNTPLVMFRILPMLGVNMPMSNDSSSSENLFLKFLHSWSVWINEELIEKSDFETWKDAIDHLIIALKYLDSSSLLTTQIGLKCSLSDEHSCAIKTITDQLESNKLYDIVNTCVEAQSTHQPQCISFTDGIVSEQRDRGSTTSISCCGESEKCNKGLYINGSHFITMILLAWPYTKCGDSKKCLKMLELSSKQISGTGAMLQNEVMLLNQQLKEILGFIDKCDKCTNCLE